MTRQSSSTYQLLGHKRSHRMRLLSLLAVLITLEMTTRLIRPTEGDRFRFDPQVGYLFRPDLDEVYTDRESDNTYTLRTNSLGFRGPEWAVPKPDDVKRIAVLGNSFVESRSFDEERNFCGRLQARLNTTSSRDDVRWEVMNFGVGGTGTPSELAIYQQIVRKLEPEIVLLCVSVPNDLPKLGKPPAPGDRLVMVSHISEQDLALVAPHPDEGKELRNFSQLYVWQKQKVQSLIDVATRIEAVASIDDRRQQYLAFKLELAKIVTQQPLSKQMQDGWRQYELLLHHFRRAVESDGGEFYLVHLPDCWQIHENVFDVLSGKPSAPERLRLREPEERLLAIVETRGLDLLDLFEPFRQEAQQNPRQDLLFLHGAGHFAERGHEVVANQIFQFLHSRSIHLAPLRNNLVLERDKRTIR